MPSIVTGVVLAMLTRKIVQIKKFQGSELLQS
jgi:hypothetical protein